MFNNRKSILLLYDLVLIKDQLNMFTGQVKGSVENEEKKWNMYRFEQLRFRHQIGVDIDFWCDKDQ